MSRTIGDDSSIAGAGGAIAFAGALWRRSRYFLTLELVEPADRYFHASSAIFPPDCGATQQAAPTGVFVILAGLILWTQ